MPIPRDQLPVGEGVFPDGSKAPFFVDMRTINLLEEFGPTEKYEDARFVPMAVAAPDAIFLGLRRPNRNESLCYSIRPERDPANDDEAGESTSGFPRFGVVFLAFADVRNMGYVVFDWEWRDEDPEEPGLPLGWSGDFAKRVYP